MLIRVTPCPFIGGYFQNKMTDFRVLIIYLFFALNDCDKIDRVSILRISQPDASCAHAL